MRRATGRINHCLIAWTLDGSGAMLGLDKVGMDRAMVKIGDVVLSASNSTPHALPAGFRMVQHLHSRSFPSGKLDTKAFLDVDHKRTLTDNATFVGEVGKDKGEAQCDGRTSSVPQRESQAFDNRGVSASA